VRIAECGRIARLVTVELFAGRILCGEGFMNANCGVWVNFKLGLPWSSFAENILRDRGVSVVKGMLIVEVG